MRKHVNLCLIALFLLVAALWGYGQPNNYRFERMGGDGVRQNSATSICQDKFGLMWWGTQEGLVRYDGMRSEVYGVEDGLGSNIVNVVCADASGNILVGTNEGFTKYDRLSDRFFSVKTASGKQIKCMLPVDSHLVWVGTETGLYLGNTETMLVQDSIANIDVTALARDQKGQLWIAQKENILVLGGQAPLTFRQSSFPRLPNGSEYASLYFSKGTGSVYAGTNTGSLIILNPNEVPDSMALGSSAIRSISVAEDSAVWVGLADSGLAIIASGKIHWIIGTEVEAGELQDHEIASVFRSDDGSMWVGTENQGVFQYNARRVIFKSFVNRGKKEEEKFAGNLVWSLCRRDENNLWIGTDANGMYYFSHLEDRFYPAAQSSLSNETVYSILKDKSGTVWAGTKSGELHACRNCAAHGNFDHTSVNLDDPINCLCESPDGRYLYVGSAGGGLSVLEKSRSGFSNIAHFGTKEAAPRHLPEDEINALHVDVGGKFLWVGTFHGRMMRLNIERFTIEEVKNAGWFGKGDPINCFFQDTINARYLWIGTHSKGIKRYDIAADSVDLTLTKDDGLLGAGGYGMVQDEMGYLWISTNRGLSRYDPTDGSFRNFGPESGLAGREFNSGAYLEAGGDGFLYFGGIEGLTEVDPKAISGGKAYQPRLVLMDMEIGGELAEVDSALHNSGVVLDRPLLGRDTVTPIELHYRDQTILVRFAAMDYANPKDAKYRWRLLEGGDTLAYGEDQKGEAMMVGYEYGNFKLEVEAANSHGKFDGARQSRAVLLIDVPAPFWNHWEFWFGVSLLLLIAMVGLWVGVMKYRDRRSLVSQQEEMLAQKKGLQTEFDLQKHQLESKNEELVVVNLRLNEVLRDYKLASIAKDRAIQGMYAAMKDKDAAMHEKDAALAAREQMIQLLNEANENEKSLNKSRQVALKDKELALLDMVRLIEIGKIATSHLNLDELVEELFPAIQKSYNFDTIALGIHEPKEDRITYRYIHKYFGGDVERKEQKIVNKRDDSSFGVRAIREGKQIHSGNVQNEKQAIFERDMLYAKSISTIVSEPLIFRDRTLAVIVGLKTGQHALTERQTHLLNSIASITSAGVQNCISYLEIQTLKSSRMRTSQSFGHETKHLFGFLKNVWRRNIGDYFEIESIDESLIAKEKPFGKIFVSSKCTDLHCFEIIAKPRYVDTLSMLVFMWTGRWTDGLILHEGAEPSNLMEAIKSSWEFAKEAMAVTALGEKKITCPEDSILIDLHLGLLVRLFPEIKFVGNEQGLTQFPIPKESKDKIMRLIGTICLNTLKHCSPSSEEIILESSHNEEKKLLEVVIRNELWPDKWTHKVSDPVGEVLRSIQRDRPELAQEFREQDIEMLVQTLFRVREDFFRLSSTNPLSQEDKWKTPEVVENLLKSLGGYMEEFGIRTIAGKDQFITRFKIRTL